MDYCSRPLSLGEYSSQAPRSNGSKKGLSSAHFYGLLTIKEFYLWVNIHPTLFTTVISRYIGLQTQATDQSGHFNALTRYKKSTPAGIFGEARRCIREVIGAVYPQLFENWGEKFKKYEHIGLFTDNLLSFDSF
ncbi:hypothetical protein [Rothia sp. RSM386]|uniref:hypothetical protein n=1 Tax=Rothia sp. RSM386 TaxID=3030213 RepID=UPI00244BEC78|nr:hypothetical protein [Rothia sp. RSM386]